MTSETRPEHQILHTHITAFTARFSSPSTRRTYPSVIKAYYRFHPDLLHPLRIGTNDDIIAYIGTLAHRVSPGTQRFQFYVLRSWFRFLQATPPVTTPAPILPRRARRFRLPSARRLQIHHRILRRMTARQREITSYDAPHLTRRMVRELQSITTFLTLLHLWRSGRHAPSESFSNASLLFSP
jgi:hypothetical protein